MELSVIPLGSTVTPSQLRLRTRIFEPSLWREIGVTSLTDLAQRMEVTTGALSKLQHDKSREPSGAMLRGALCAFRGWSLSDLFYLEPVDA
jgi:hypothetical protein